MPHHCAVPGCTSNSKTSQHVSFHQFPSDTARRRIWVRNIRRDESKGVWVINSSTRVCSKHFTDESYHSSSTLTSRRRMRKTTRTNKILKSDAVPTVFDCFPERLQPTTSKRKAPANREPPKRKKCIDVPGDNNQSIPDDKSDVDSEFDEETATSMQHEHCKCVESLQETVESLKDEIATITSELVACQRRESELKEDIAKERSRCDFSLDRFKNDNKKIRLYTGFTTYGMFEACFNFLSHSAKVMRNWQGKRTKTDERTTDKTGPKSKLPLEEQFFMVMVRLRLGLSVEDLADRFFISPSTVSRTFITWINLMYVKFKELPMWMSRSKVDKWMPPYFKKWYPTTRVIIDATEFYIEKPSSLARQSATWSSYKNHNTFKVLVGISPDGTLVYISHLYEGSMTDVDLVAQCGLLSLLENGDSVMADKGFDIQHLLSRIGVRLNIPPFRQGDQQFTPDDILKTKKIAAVRIHVERAINRMKQYALVKGVIPNSLWDIAEQLIFVAGYLTNFEPGLAA